MKNILFVHQSAELYGSDKTLLLLVMEFKNKGINPIIVLPEKGPLFEILTENGITVILTSVIKISRTMFGIKNLLTLPFQINSSIKQIDEACKHIQIDLVYSNTLAVLIGLIYAKKRNIKHIWHIHEIIQKPKLVKTVFFKLISLKTNNHLIYNSFATRSFWEKSLQIKSIKSDVVWNGLSKDRSELSTHDLDNNRLNLFNAGKTHLVIALVGRINKWKGHQLLLTAFKNLPKETTNAVKLVFVGSAPPNREIYLTELIAKIEEYKMESQVMVIPFQQNIANVWQAIDIAVVPSTEPEPFGLVALEAMLYSKPVIAANHGGLKEIVVNDITGLLFEPNSLSALELCLKTLIDDKRKREFMGENGCKRAITEFTLGKYVTKIEQICLNI